MNYVKWNQVYSVGIKQIDTYNFYLFNLLNHAYRHTSLSCRNKPKRTDLEEILRYAQFHFAREEVWMAHTQYALLPAHEEEHKQLKQTLTQLCIGFKSDLTSTREPLRALIESLLSHVRNWDAVYGSSDSANRLSAFLRSNRYPPK